MNFDKDKFLFLYQNEFGNLNASQAAGVEFLLSAIENDDEISDVRWAAYMLATVKHECAGTWQPIEEYGKGAGKKYGPTGFWGRGFVQLTWKENYQAMSQVTGLDLVNHPEMALNAGTAYQIMSYGMRKGSFTGVKLSTYIKGDDCDFVGARKIINGTDQAAKIAGYAEKINEMLCKTVIA